MKRKELQTLRGKKIAELSKLVIEKKQEILTFSTKVKASKEKNLKKAKNLKKEVAQILTIIREIELSKKEKGTK